MQAVTDEHPFVKEGKAMKEQLVIIVTDHWTHTWFSKMVLPHSRFADVPLDEIIFFDIAGDGAWQDHFNNLASLLRKLGTSSTPPICFAVTDVAMEIYSAVREELKGEVDLRGSHFGSFFLATNKLACRQAIRGAETMKVAAVMSDQEFLPDLLIDGFFKPLAECGSKGVFKCGTGERIPNPLKGTKNKSVLHQKIHHLASAQEELRPFLDEKLVGLVEEYVHPAGRRIVSVDGYVYNGKIHHYAISDNIYVSGSDDFDSLVTPSQEVKEGSAEWKIIWELYDKMAGDLIRRGLDNQYLDFELLIFPSGRIEIMEVNCRTFSNQLPLFTRVFGKDHCMFSNAIDIQRDQRPPKADMLPSSDGQIGVCAYLKLIPEAPDFVESDEKDAAYYSCGPSYPAHVYVVGKDGPESARKRCDEFHAIVKKRFSREHGVSQTKVDEVKDGMAKVESQEGSGPKSPKKARLLVNVGC